MTARRPWACAALLLLGLAGCTPDPVLEPIAPCGEVAWPDPAEDWSVVMIVTDTTRRDRSALYGGPVATPHLDSLAAEGQVFDRAYSQAPWTKPSIATLFTSLHPSQHRLRSHPRGQERAHQAVPGRIHRSAVLREEFRTLAEAFRDAGFATAAFVSNPWLDSRFGLARGFEHYDDSFARWGASGKEVNAAALQWLGAREPGSRHFLYLHYIDNHRPHPALTWDDLRDQVETLRADTRPLEPAARREIRSFVRMTEDVPPAIRRLPANAALMTLAYDKGVAAFDAALGHWLDGLAPHWSAEKSLVIVTSDHGEALFEHGFGNHGESLHGGEIDVPLVVRVPGGPVGRVSCPVGLIDLMPTLCDYLGLACPERMYGQSLLEGKPRRPRYLVSEGVVTGRRDRALTDGRHKLVFAPGDEPAAWSLYDLATDADEQHDLLEANDARLTPERLRGLQALLALAVPEVKVAGAPPSAEIDPALRQQLERLGYLEPAPEAP